MATVSDVESECAAVLFRLLETVQTIVNKEEASEGRQTSEVFALIGF